jgi:UPF0042 nucleotide-binding protein
MPNPTEDQLPQADNRGKLHVIIVSGLSGAGKTVVLRALEDSGYFCIDNLPVILIEPFLKSIATVETISKVGIGVDVREKHFLSQAYRIFSALRDYHHVEVLFVEAEKDAIVRRYKETRRPHPMMPNTGDLKIESAIEQERTLLLSIREAADKVIDTSNHTPHTLRQLVLTTYREHDKTQVITISLLSFGYKFGVPLNLDLLFDVRFIPNPYFVPELRELKGTDPLVSDFVLKRSETKEFLSRVYALLDFLIPHYIREGKTYLTVGIGCTGGRHRSPPVVEEISAHIRQHYHVEPQVVHRDME